jgi:hypothetical protein
MAQQAKANAVRAEAEAAPEVPPGVEPGSADRGVPGSSEGESAKRNTGEEKGRGGRVRGVGEVGGQRRTPRPGALIRRWQNYFCPLSQENNGSR